MWCCSGIYMHNPFYGNLKNFQELKYSLHKKHNDWTEIIKQWYLLKAQKVWWTWQSKEMPNRGSSIIYYNDFFLYFLTSLLKIKKKEGKKSKSEDTLKYMFPLGLKIPQWPVDFSNLWIYGCGLINLYLIMQTC